MDKKKVIELIEDTILMVDTIEGFDDGDTEQLLNVRRKLNGALDELSKSDWISVEDELPPYGESVWCTNSRFPSAVWTSYRIKEEDNDEFTTDNSDFVRDYQGGHDMTYYHDIVTHWRKIDKLEVWT